MGVSTIYTVHGVLRHLLFHLTAKQKITIAVIFSCTVCTTRGDTLWSMASQCLMSFLNDTHYSRRHTLVHSITVSVVFSKQIRRHTLVHHIGVFSKQIYTTQGDTLWSMASQCLVSFLNRGKQQKQLTNASIIKMGLSGDLLRGFGGIATIEATELGSCLSKIFKNAG